MKTKLLLLLIINVAYTSFVKSQVKANAGKDVSICLNDSLKVIGKGLNAGDTGTYQWKDLSNNVVYSNSQVLKLKITILTSRQYELTVTKTTYKGTLTGKDTFELTVNPLPMFVYQGIPSRCYNDGCTNFTNMNPAAAMPGNITGLRYFQKFKKPSWITSTSPYIYCPKINNAQVPQNGLRDTFCYEYTDGNGCYNYECKTIRTNPNPLVHIKNGIFCQKAGKINLTQLVDTPFVRTGGIESYKVISVPIGSGIDPNKIISLDASSGVFKYYMDPGLDGEYNKTGDYIIEYCFKNPSSNCQRCDTSTITVKRLPKIKFGAIPAICVNNAVVDLDSFVKDSITGKRLLNGSWQCIEYAGSRDMNNSGVKGAINNSIKNQKYFDPGTNKPNGGNYLLKYTDVSSGCPVTDSVEATVYGLPQIILQAPDTVCSKSGLYQLRSKNYQANDTNGKWTGNYVTGNQFNSDAVVMGNSYTIQSKLFFSYTNPQTNCKNTDSTYKTAIRKPAFKFSHDLHPNSKYLVDFSIIDSNMYLGDFQWLWYFGNGDTSVNKYPKGIFYTDSGDYKTFLTINNGFCNVQDSISFNLNKVIEGLDRIKKLIRIYPNPGKDIINIYTPVDGSLSLFDFEGKILINSKLEANRLNTLNIIDFKDGIYFLSITNGEVQYWTKIVKL